METLEGELAAASGRAEEFEARVEQLTVSEREARCRAEVSEVREAERRERHAAHCHMTEG